MQIQWRLKQNQGYDSKALHASERGRARSLLDILAESGADIKKGVDPQLLAEEQRLLQRLNALYHFFVTMPLIYRRSDPIVLSIVKNY